MKCEALKLKAFADSKILASQSRQIFPASSTTSTLKPNRMMGLIKRKFSFKNKDVILKEKLGAYAEAARGLSALLRDIGP